MPNEERIPELVPLSDRARPPDARRGAPPAAPSPKFNFTPASALGLTAGLLLLAGFALYLLWHVSLHLLAPAGLGLPPAGEAPPASQTAPGVPAGSAAPAYGGVPAGTLPAPGADREEDIAPPAPGLLISKFSLENLSYTGPDNSTPASLTKETAEDKAGCKAGDALKCLRLGARYLGGRGVERDAVRAFSLINKACAGGIAEACTMQGVLQASGYGTARDVPAAMELYKKTCAAGDMNGCTMLGSAYIDGKDLPADTARGLGLLRKACAANLPAACAGLGVIYLDGRIAPADPAAAERFLGQACDSNEKNSCQLLQQLAQKRAAAGGGR